jgi:hypothetical protein
MAVGRAEVQMPWGGHLALTPQGDLALVQDTPFSAAATQQRLVQLVQTNAQAQIVRSDGSTVYLRPDDLFNPTYGSSIRRTIGELPTSQLLATVRARVLAGIALDPGIAQSPAPVVTVTLVATSVVEVVGSVYDITGRYIPIPPTQVLIF